MPEMVFFRLSRLLEDNSKAVTQNEGFAWDRSGSSAGQETSAVADVRDDAGGSPFPSSSRSRPESRHLAPQGRHDNSPGREPWVPGLRVREP